MELSLEEIYLRKSLNVLQNYTSYSEKNCLSIFVTDCVVLTGK